MSYRQGRQQLFTKMIYRLTYSQRRGTILEWWEAGCLGNFYVDELPPNRIVSAKVQSFEIRLNQGKNKPIWKSVWAFDDLATYLGVPYSSGWAKDVAGVWLVKKIKVP